MTLISRDWPPQRAGRAQTNDAPAVGSLPIEPEFLILHRVEINVATLGPAPCAALWVAGCPLACRGCISVDTWDPRAGVRVRVADVADWLHGLSTRFLSISGGEPAEQAGALVRLIDTLRQRDRTWVVTLFSGYTLSQLQTSVASAQLLRRVDLLKAGPYVEAEHADLLWRGSSGQELIDLTARAPIPDVDRSLGVEVRQSADGEQVVIGVPPVPGFSTVLTAAAAEHGLALPPSRRPHRFPFPTLTEEA